MAHFISVATSNQTGGGYGYGHVAQYPPVAAQGSAGAFVNQHPPPAYTSGAANPGATGGKDSFQPQY